MLKKLLSLVLVAGACLLNAPAQASIVGPLPYTLTNGTPADAAQVMANFNKIVNDVNNNVVFPSFTQQGYYAVGGGTANALTVTVSPAPTIYAPGMVINVKVLTTNTGAATINANSLGAQNIVNLNGSALKSQQMTAGMVATLVYDGTQFQLISLSPLAIRQSAVSRTTILFTASGAWTFTAPVGVYAVRVQEWGGGGGGGGAAAGPYGGGGASGAYGVAYLAVVPGDVISGNVGIAGTAGAIGPTAGGAGGSTTLLLNGVLQATATGGAGGATGATGIGGTGPNVSGTWNLSASGQNGGGAGVLGPGGSAPTGGPGGVNTGAGCGNGGAPGGGGGGGSTSAGCAGGAGWVYLEY